MKTIGLPLYQELPNVDEAPALQKICQHYSGRVTIRVRDLEMVLDESFEVKALSQHGGEFMRIIAEGPDEGLLAGAVHQQLVKDKYCY